MSATTVTLAGEAYSVECLHGSFAAMCADYITAAEPAAAISAAPAAVPVATSIVAPAAAPAVPAIHLSISQSDIEHEREASAQEDAAAGRDQRQFSDGYLETLAVLRKIAEQLPLRRRMLMHGAAIEYGGRAYLFCAPSGTGKTTHIRLWREHLGDAVQIINGDKPFVEVPPEGAPIVHGTPWAGKEGWQRNASAPLAGVCFLSQAPANSIRALSPAEALDRAIRQTYLPSVPEAAGLTLELLDGLLARVPLYALACNISPDAVRCSFETMTGQRFLEGETHED